MADPTDGHRLFARPDAPHGVHDLLLVAAFAAGDAQGEDEHRARSLVDACPDCARLADDLRTLRQASAALPPPGTRRPRDFRLTPADAERLRPQGVRRFVAAVAPPRLSRAHPIAAGLTMLGITGLLVSTISFGAPASSTGINGEDPSGRALESNAPAAATEDLELQGQPAAGAQASEAPAQPASPGPAEVGGDVALVEASPFPREAVAVGSGLLVASGLGLFVVASRPRRRFE